MNHHSSIVRADARRLPLTDNTVDLVVTSPPYFGLRSYTDNGQHYDGQIGSEPTPAEFVEALLAATREMVRCLKPSGSIFVNLGDKYAGSGGAKGGIQRLANAPGYHENKLHGAPISPALAGVPTKSLIGIPWRYALACIDQLGLILRAEIIWAKPNGLPESVTDRVRRSHETWFHFVRSPRYFSAVDEIRESYDDKTAARYAAGYGTTRKLTTAQLSKNTDYYVDDLTPNPLGKLPGSVWTVPTQPLTVPPELGVDHFACVDTETEILTSRGWLTYDQLKIGDLAAGYDLLTNRSKWTHVEAINTYSYDGEMVSVESRDLSMRLTPNHRAVVQRMHTRSKRRTEASVVDADHLDRYHFIPRSTAWEHTTDDSVGTGWASILGWVAAEGWYQGRCVYLSQSASANPDKVKQIDTLLPDATWRRERERIWRGRPWLDVNWRLSDYDAAAVQAAMPDKLLPASLITATTSERWAVLNAFVAGDGHIRPEDERISIFQKKRHNLDVLQAIAVTLGYKTSLQFSGGRWVLYLTHGGRSTTLRATNGNGSKVEREHYTGTVWCPTTGTGTFIARRRGIPFITGNSFPMEWPRRIIAGWSPTGICTVCGEGRRPVTAGTAEPNERLAVLTVGRAAMSGGTRMSTLGRSAGEAQRSITGYACACPDTTAPTRPSTVLDPFGGTGTAALVASVMGRTGISVDMSADYCRLAQWRVNDPGQRAAAAQVEKPDPVSPDQLDLFTDHETMIAQGGG